MRKLGFQQIDIWIFDSRKHENNMCLKNTLVKYLKGGFTIEKTSNGKPFICSKANEKLALSISHKNYLYVVAVTKIEGIGIDLEFINVNNSREKISSKYSFNDFSKCEPIDSFYMNWTLREAYIKAVNGTLFAYLAKIQLRENNSEILVGVDNLSHKIIFNKFHQYLIAVCFPKDMNPKINYIVEPNIFL